MAILAAIGALAFFLGGNHIVLLHPRGAIAARELQLMETAVQLMLLVVVPVFILTFGIAWHYRAENTRARYLPNWDHNVMEEAVWWIVPMIIIVVLAVLTWRSTHQLDPYRAIDASTPPLTIQVVALDWKWLFLYPAQGIATVNYLEIPEHTPIDFEITADAPMNGFWIPQLGGQIMAMPGMVTHLHLIADGPGTYLGLSSNFSGAGFAGMQFSVQATTTSAFTSWATRTAHATTTLDFPTYQALARPSAHNPPTFYALSDIHLYTKIVMQFMASSSPVR